jgi:flagellar hook-basal body complex protein FliE
MSLKLSGIPLPAPIELPSTPLLGGSTSTAGSSFKDILGSAIQQVEGARTDANLNVDKFLSGEGDDLHSVILGSQRAELEFQMFLQVRNKVVSAYQEVMRMQM